jgi:hypothetical protein
MVGMPYLRFVIFFSIVSIPCFQDPAYGQEMFGASLGNYAGVSGLQLNPSSMLSSKAYLDINLLGLDIFVQTNYFYIDKKDYRFLNFFKAGYQLPEHSMEYGTESRSLYTYDNNHLTNGYEQVRVNGPGAVFLHGKHAFALTTGARSVLSAKAVPHEIPNFAYLGLNYVPQHNINYKDNRSFRMGEMTWMEVGLSYAYTFYTRDFASLSVGITVRRLFGYAGLYLKSTSADYVVPDDSTISVHNFDGQLGYSLPMNYDDNGMWNDKLFKGGGFSGDLGITYTRLSSIYAQNYSSTPCSQPYNSYLYRIGVAVIDVGAIRFKTHAETYSIDNRSSYWDDVNEFKFQNIHHFMDTVSYQFYGDNNAAYRGSSFYMWLPSALSVQFDYHYQRNWYVNFTLIYGFDIGPASVSRPAQLAITPRYETRGFEASLPVSLYNWQKPRIGLALRYYYITLGTEKLGQFFHFSNFTGLDFYLSIHYFIDKGRCRNSKGEGCKEKDFRINSGYR